MSITGTVPAEDYKTYGLLATGLAADRPAPGIEDRFYFSTDTLVLERDTGVAWVEVVRGEAAIRLVQLAERAHSSLTGIGAADHHARYTDAEALAQAAALIAIHAAIAAAHHTKTTDAAEITTGTFPVARGGTGLNTIALGGILYASALDILSRLAPTAANQVLRSTAANALQFAALLAADIPNLDAGKITSGVFALPRIPNMDWAHISGLFPRTIAALLSNHNLANHPLAIIPVMDDGHIPDLETLSYGGAFAVAQIPGLPASQITSGQFPLNRMPRAASGLFLEGNGVAANPIYNALVAANIPNLDTSKITTGRFPVARLPAMTDEKIWKGTGGNVEEIDVPADYLHAYIMPRAYSAIGQGTFSFGCSMMGTYPQAWNYDCSSAADGDNISYRIWLAAGTYYLGFNWMGHVYYGIVDVDLDDVQIGSKNCYNAGGYIVGSYITASFNVPSTGVHTLKFRTDGKHASSTGYHHGLGSIVIGRAS